jgi:hypothetical protein
MKIAFGYKCGVGKDLSVKYLINKYKGRKIAFADPLYDILYYAQNVCGFKNEKDRKFLQFIGTTWAREKDNDIWVKLALERCKEPGYYYCSDVRFLNEFNALKKNGWVMVKIVKDRVDNKRIGSGEKDHISENELDCLDNTKWDYVITNNGSFKELYEKLDKIVDNIIYEQLNKIIEQNVIKLLE